ARKLRVEPLRLDRGRQALWGVDRRLDGSANSWGREMNSGLFLATGDPGRRLRPRIIDSDWLLMRGLTTALSAAFQRYLGDGMTWLDFGCGTRPYEALVGARRCDYVGADLDETGPVRIDSEGRLTAADGSVDAVGSFQVLEHVRDVDRYLDEARRV